MTTGFGTPITITDAEKRRYDDTIREMKPYAAIARALDAGDIDEAKRLVANVLRAGQTTLEAITQRGIERAQEPEPEPLPWWRRWFTR